MKVTVVNPTLAVLKSGDLFAVSADPVSVYMAVGEAVSGQRQAVRLNDGALTAIDATMGIQRFPEVALTINT